MSEKAEAKRSGHKLQRNSGRGPYAKGDALSDYFLVDYKEAEKSFTLNKKVWGKVVTDTLRVDPDRMPALMVIIGLERKIRLALVEWAVVEEYESLRSEYEQLKQDYDDLYDEYNFIRSEYKGLKWTNDEREE